MKANNHILGGFVFTGFIASFWDINIFSKPSFLLAVILGSLLPDIDTKRSLMGRIFFFVSFYIEKKFGHRSITHSLLFIVFITSISFIIQKLLGHPNLHYTFLISISILGHLLLDSLTVMGVPLFYPFLKNYCVMPANPDHRLKSGSLVGNIITSFFFILMLALSYPLMSQGFWLAFNNSLGSKKQVYSQFKRSDQVLLVDYTFRRDFETLSGSGYLFDATSSKLTLYDTLLNKFVFIESSDITKDFKLNRSSLYNADLFFTTVNINSFEDLNLIKSKNLYSLELNSDRSISYIINGKRISSNSISYKFINFFDYNFIQVNNSAQIELKLIDQFSILSKYKQANQAYVNAQHKLSELNSIYFSASDYNKKDILKQIEQLKAINRPVFDSLSYSRLDAEIKLMRAEEKTNIYITGVAKIMN